MSRFLVKLTEIGTSWWCGWTVTHKPINTFSFLFLPIDVSSLFVDVIIRFFTISSRLDVSDASLSSATKPSRCDTGRIHTWVTVYTWVTVHTCNVSLCPAKGACVHIEVSDQHVQPCSLIWVFDGHSKGGLGRVPTSSGYHGKSGKSLDKVPCMEKSWNLKKPK